MASRGTILPFIVSRGDTSRMTVAEAHRFVHDVLMYLQALERAAELRNRRPLVLHYQQCWLTVCEACFGEGWNPSGASLHTTAAAAVPAQFQRPRWFIQKYSRPMRRVVARMSKTHVDRGRKNSYTINYDVLSCGHMVEDYSATCGTAPAKHRRCDECARTDGALPRIALHPVSKKVSRETSPGSCLATNADLDKRVEAPSSLGDK